MSTSKQKLFTSIKWILAVLATINLIALFIFDYRIPFLSSGSDAVSSDYTADSSSVPADSGASAKPSLSILVPSDHITYDGSEELNLTEDITILDQQGNERSDKQLTTTVEPGNSPYEKVIIFSCMDDNGISVTAQQTITLPEDYTGPVINAPESMPVTAEDEIDSTITAMLTSQEISADDGFGHDITQYVSIESKAVTAEDEVTVRLIVTNDLADTCSVDLIFPTAQHGPVVKLLTHDVVLSVGDSFSIYSYIDYARAEDGTNLSGRISVNGHVDTSTPGVYELEFYCSDTDGNVSKREKLTVTVE